MIGTNFLLELNADGLEPRLRRRRLGEWSVQVYPAGTSSPTARSRRSARRTKKALPAARIWRSTATPPPGSLTPPSARRGLRRFDLNGNQEAAKVASWGADGSVIVGGRTQLRGPCPKECEEVPILVAFTAAGELEAGFARGGVLRLASLAAKPDGYRSLGVAAMARRPDGSIVAAGNAPPNETVAFLAAVSPAGGAPARLREAGSSPSRNPFAPISAGRRSRADAGRQAARGGHHRRRHRDQPVLIRYDPDGSLDRSFGAGAGYVILRRSQGGSSHGATGFAVQGDNVLTGVYDYPLSHLLMVRAGDGSPRCSFGSDGSIDLPREVRVAALAFARDGDPLVLGIQRVAGPPRRTRSGPPLPVRRQARRDLRSRRQVHDGAGRTRGEREGPRPRAWRTDPRRRQHRSPLRDDCSPSSTAGRTRASAPAAGRSRSSAPPPTSWRSRVSAPTSTWREPSAKIRPSTPHPDALRARRTARPQLRSARPPRRLAYLRGVTRRRSCPPATASSWSSAVDHDRFSPSPVTARSGGDRSAPNRSSSATCGRPYPAIASSSAGPRTPARRKLRDLPPRETLT